MNINADVEKVINTLSSKFHKIFCDRDFVCCVLEDFQVILRNRNRCCVVVFPLLGRNYLKAVQYQAELFDLVVFTLGSGKNCFVAVCDTKFLIKKEEIEEQIMPNNEEAGTGNNSKKKRPERQLYVPPAQRRLPISELPNGSKTDHGSSPKARKQISTTSRKKELPEKVKAVTETERPSYNEDNIRDAILNQFNEVSNFSYMWWKYELSDPLENEAKSVYSKSFMKKSRLCNLRIRNIYKLETTKSLYILSKNFVLWQPKFDVLMNNKKSYMKAISPSSLDQSDVKDSDTYYRASIMTNFCIEKTYIQMLEEFNIYCDVDVLIIKNNWEPKRAWSACYGDFFYINDNNCDEISTIEDMISDFLIISEEKEKELVGSKPEKEVENIISYVPENEKTNIIKEHVIKTNSEVPHQNVFPPQKNNLKNVIPNSNMNYLKNSINLTENVKVKNDLEEEKEIMRKAKENINRKTRPIIKYVDEANDTLKIEKNDVNNWEDLFDEEGQIQEDLLKEIVHKVGKNVTIVKAKEDYSDYFSKHVKIEELEHMVELYDFPASLETHDLIHAFNEIKSDAMYIKWVDDTHAILVLGSSTQAQRAINVQNPLIKVRPMVAASKSTLSIAYQNDLKPAMKRPATNLQTARRLITTHLGTKSGITSEISAKERNDLKAAREMKRLVKKNEQDAWDGNLRSSMN
ncbi:uncharacterized protein LOC126878551 isoform X1 [Diabrotica virgifera virgifera]|uniref:Coiled-coil domain-containing protein R3HCC1L n=1 Tax=Diabrotica virgifera virgifera TaxID=50390 RepID=A0ABM5JH72_DIAVI|nr:uncharacterized protein LOC126878551 isoform X1 [Diabrotica virgifera virgifera]XP_050497285.1 uncharacterized protein LOC126878551 isoform X1 [Diabrotica virgifera virgifera]XP_050497286.1 uncharacterized protein LOC126878551 isoform X1 [Diabrotica virgifera virgifera]